MSTTNCDYHAIKKKPYKGKKVLLHGPLGLFSLQVAMSMAHIC